MKPNPPKGGDGKPRVLASSEKPRMTPRRTQDRRAAETSRILGGKLMNTRYLAIMITLALLSVGCATIVNDPNIPLSFSFSDGSSGKCDLRNKRGTWTAELPATNVMIRRSDDALVYDCTTEDGREVSGSIRSEMEGGKMAASVLFWDFGITDSITDKHRT